MNFDIMILGADGDSSQGIHLLLKNGQEFFLKLDDFTSIRQIRMINKIGIFSAKITNIYTSVSFKVVGQ